MGLRSYSDYLDYDYTPGELARMSVSQYNFTPMKEQETIAKLRWDSAFTPEAVNPLKTDAFEQFMLMSKSPEAFMSSKMTNLPDRFLAMQNMVI